MSLDKQDFSNCFPRVLYSYLLGCLRQCKKVEQAEFPPLLYQIPIRIVHFHLYVALEFYVGSLRDRFCHLKNVKTH